MTDFTPVITQNAGNISGPLYVTDEQAIAAKIDISRYQGAAAYIHIRYANSATPGDGEMSIEPGDYLGIAVSSSPEAPTAAGAYTWQYMRGAAGPAGNGIASVERTSGTGEPGITDTYTITFTDGSFATFTVYNGANGEGAGDMMASVYDPDGDGLIDQAKTIAGTIEINQVQGLESVLLEKADGSTLIGHTGDKDNPHGVTPGQIGAATTAHYTATLLSSGWTGDAAPFSQTVAVEGILETDTPFVDIVQTGSEDTDSAIRDGWGKITRITTANGSITAYASEVPGADVPIQMKVVG